MENPYQSSTVNPTASPQPNAYNSQNLEASQTAIYFLAASKGWVRFMSVLMFICLGLFVLGLIITMVESRGIGNPEIVGILIILTLCAITFFLALRLSLYASAIGRLIVSRNPIDLETAMIQQMKYWRLSGVITLIALVITIIALIAG